MKIWRQQKNIGALDNWNFLLSKASGTYFQLLPSDDWMLENYFSIFLECLGRADLLSYRSDDIIAIIRPSLNMGGYNSNTLTHKWIKQKNAIFKIADNNLQF